MPDDGLKKFINTLTKSDADEDLLESVKGTYSKQISSAVEFGEDILDRAKTKIQARTQEFNSLNSENRSVPTLQSEQFENNLEKTNKDAISTVMRPDVPEYSKKSNLFKSLDYKVRADRFTVLKDVGKNTKISAAVDIFDKSAGIGFEKQVKNERTRISGNLEYEPFDNAIEASMNYNDGRNNFSGSIYLKEGNPGISSNFAQTITPKTEFKINASLFSSDAAFKAELDTKLKDNSNLSLGAYGSTKYKEIGVTARLSF